MFSIINQLCSITCISWVRRAPFEEVKQNSLRLFRFLLLHSSCKVRYQGHIYDALVGT